MTEFRFRCKTSKRTFVFIPDFYKVRINTPINKLYRFTKVNARAHQSTNLCFFSFLFAFYFFSFNFPLFGQSSSTEPLRWLFFFFLIICTHE